MYKSEIIQMRYVHYEKLLTRITGFAKVHDEKNKRHPAFLVKATELVQSMQLNDRNDFIELYYYYG